MSTKVCPSGRHRRGGCCVRSWRYGNAHARRLPRKDVKRVLTALVHPPHFVLPPYRVAHMRHYMPMEKKGPADRTLVFDTFVVIGRSNPRLIAWPDAELSSEDIATLDKLLLNLSSLGRAESWIYAESTDDQPAWNCGPAADSTSTRALCPDPSTGIGCTKVTQLLTQKNSRKER